ncbi:hypothetical protein FQA39_LY05216 [Lamprigera yunnana]|nr:hypothetical protein FQA39_LY05216 [Lamprigera yunnana]
MQKGAALHGHDIALVSKILPPLYELDGTVHDSIDSIPFNTVRALKQKHPEFMAGYDLVGQEDTKHPINHYLRDLKSIFALGVDFFFHAGEINWFKIDSDFNLVDAILLGTKRIGHAYAVTKDFQVLKYTKEHIAIEVCPISNQVLILVRNHPAPILFANGYPFVISYDDPTLWNVKDCVVLKMESLHLLMIRGQHIAESDIRVMRVEGGVKDRQLESLKKRCVGKSSYLQTYVPGIMPLFLD